MLIYLIIGLVLCGIAAFVFIKQRNSSGSKGVYAGSSIAAVAFERRILKNSNSDVSKVRSNLAQSERNAQSTPRPSAAPAPRVNLASLPVVTMHGVVSPPVVTPLPSSDDADLAAAIEELSIDEDSDAEFRLVALRVVAANRCANSVDALSQAALYDLSSTLRASSVMFLSDIDHESVFDAIIMAAADPSREVRAAAARALSKLTFDRGDAWARLAASNDELYSRQIARAAVESGIAERLFERLAMRDERAAYEAFALVALLMRTGESEKIFDAIRNHRDQKTRLSLLHAVRTTRDPSNIPYLTRVIGGEPLGSQVGEVAREVLFEINAAPKPVLTA